MARIIPKLGGIFFDISAAFSGRYDANIEYINNARREIYLSIRESNSGCQVDKSAMREDFHNTSMYFHEAFLKYKEEKLHETVLDYE